MPSDSAVHALAGAAGGAVSMALTYPLITISTRAAVESKKPEHARESLVAAVRRVVKQEGLAGLFDGLESSILGIAVTNAAFYYFFEESRAALLRRKSAGQAKLAASLSTLESILASFIAGCATSIVTNPIWVVNTNQISQAALDDSDATLQTKRDPKTGEKIIVKKLGFLATVRKIYRKNGLTAFCSTHYTTVYASQAPAKLPATLIARHILRTAFTGVYYLIRFLFVAFIWLAFLPYSVLWVWRGLFHLAKGWGTSWTAAIQEIEWRTIGLSTLFMPNEQQYRSRNANVTSALAAQAAAGITPAATASKTALSAQGGNEGTVMTLSRMINGTIVSTSVKPKVEALEDAVTELFKAWFKPEDKAANLHETVIHATGISSNTNTTASWLPRSSLIDRALNSFRRALSHQWTAHKDLLYSMGEDVFSGQIIVACVIVAFIAAFLLREWVMANQPNVHVDGAGVNQPAVAPAPNVDAERLQAVQDVIARFQEINERREREGLGAGNGEDGPLIPLRLELRRELGLPPIEPLPIGLETARSDDSSDDIRRAREAGEALYSEGSFTPRLERAGSARLDRDEEEASSRESSPTGSDEEASAGLIRRRVWSSETYSGEASELAGSSKIPGLPAHFAHASQRNSPSASTSEATSPLLPATLPRSASNDFGIESASEGELENEPAAAPMIGPIPAPAAANPARRAARAHDLGNDSDTDDDLEDDLFGPVDPPAGARAMQNDAVLFEGDENPDDLFFEADLQGILEAVGIQGPILALLQNVALVSLLIACLLVVAIWLPLMFGKTIAATNAQKIVLLPVNLVRLFTDPLADRLIGIIGKRQIVAPPEPTFRNRLSHALGRLVSSPAKRSESPLQLYIGHYQKLVLPYIEALRLAVAKFAMDSVKAIKSEWYAMAVGDSNFDRTLCIALGYFVILAGAAAYLRHTQNIQAREAGTAVREIVKQHFTLVKAAFFFFVEIVVFPTLCGLLINLSTLPLIPGSTISIRLAYYLQKPVSTIFLTWLAGTNFMFSFAQAISIVRKSIRKGVLYFIRDPADPEANPLREILETPAINQAKKITRSLFVYGGIVVTCFGFFPWLSRLVPFGLFPLRWDLTRPLSTVPWDLIYLLTIVPLTIGRARPKRAIRNLFKRWCTITAHQLRLSSFMLGKRLPDEEGTHVRRTWKAWVLLQRAPVPTSLTSNKYHNQAHIDDKKSTYSSSDADVIFRKDGGFARTVGSDNVKIVNKKMFVRTNEHGEALTEEGKEAIRLQLKEPSNQDENKFVIVYIPPNFKSRILLFIYLLWLSCAIGIFVAFVSPLIVGRVLLDLFFKEPLHDTYSIIVGIHALTFLSFAYRFVKRRIQLFIRYRRSLSTYALGANPAKEVISVLIKKTLHLILLAINGAVVLPLLVGFATHFYIFIPLGMAFGNNVAASTSTRTDDDHQASSLSSALAEISILMTWCYGVVITNLVCQVATGVMKENWMSIFLDQVKTQGILRNAPRLNRLIFKVNWTLLLALIMPVAVTYSHRLSIQLIWRYLWKSQNGTANPMLPKSAYSQAYVFRIALLSVSITTLAILLSGPVKRMSKKWSEKVWEKEFVVKRKLRNMDDTDGENGSAAIVGRDEAVPEGEAPLPALAPDVDMVD